MNKQEIKNMIENSSYGKSKKMIYGRFFVRFNNIFSDVKEFDFIQENLREKLSKMGFLKRLFNIIFYGTPDSFYLQDIKNYKNTYLTSKFIEKRREDMKHF